MLAPRQGYTVLYAYPVSDTTSTTTDAAFTPPPTTTGLHLWLYSLAVTCDSYCKSSEGVNSVHMSVLGCHACSYSLPFVKFIGPRQA